MNTWNGNLKFVGDEGVQVNASAHSTNGVIDDVRFTCIVPKEGTYEQKHEVERLRGIAKEFIGQLSGAWTGQGSVYDARRPNPSRRTTKRHGVLHDEYGPFKPDGTLYQGARETGFAGSSWGDGTVVFNGNEGVSISVLAHTAFGVVDDVVALDILPSPNLLSSAQREEVRRLTALAKDMMVGKPIGQAFAQYDARTHKAEIDQVIKAFQAAEADQLREEARVYPDFADELRKSAEVNTENRTPSNTLSRVLREMRDREQFGLSKYGTTVDRTDLSVKQWLQHAKEEAMDSVLYLDRLIQEEERRALPPEGMFADVKYKSVLDELPPDLAKAIRKFFKLDHCEHNTAVTLSDVWVEAFFGHGDVGLPNAKTRRRTPTESFFDTRLSA